MTIAKIFAVSRLLAIIFTVSLPFRVCLAQTPQPSLSKPSWLAVELYKSGRTAYDKHDYATALDFLNAFKNKNLQRFNADDLSPEDIIFRREVQKAIMDSEYQVAAPQIRSETETAVIYPSHLLDADGA